VALEGRRELCRAQPDLELIPPPIEHLLGILGEPHCGDAFFVFGASTEVLWAQGIETPEDLVRAVLGLRVGPAVHVPPTGRRVGPHQHLEALQ